MKKFLICTCLMLATMYASATESRGGYVQPSDNDIGYVMPDFYLTSANLTATEFIIQDFQQAILFSAPQECTQPAQVVTDVTAKATETRIRMTLAHYTWPSSTAGLIMMQHRARATLSRYNYIGNFTYRSATA